jgi:hypothetical protein
MKRTMHGGIKKDKLDHVFSLYIRTRDAWTCQRCDKFYQEKALGYHCSHFIGRRNRAVRWDEDNCAGLCRGCHDFFAANPHLHTEWMEKRLGLTRFWELKLRGQEIPRLRKADMDALYAHYKAKLAELERRAA